MYQPTFALSFSIVCHAKPIPNSSARTQAGCVRARQSECLLAAIHSGGLCASMFVDVTAGAVMRYHATHVGIPAEN